MATTVFVPHPEIGHLNPTLKLARTLLKRGHAVYYLGLPDFEHYVRSQALDYIPILKKRCPRGYLSQAAGLKARLDLDNLNLIQLLAKGDNGAGAFDLMRDMGEEIETISRRLMPDLFIIDFKLRDLAEITAKRLGVATAIISVTLIDLAPLTGTSADVAAFSGFPELFLCPKEFDFPSAIKRNRYYVEPSIELDRREGIDFPWNKVDASKPLIYCSFGSHTYQYEQVPELFRTVVEAVRLRPQWQLVLAVGSYINAADFDCGADNVLVVNWAPQLEMLKRARMMITHGGLGAVKECIYFGVPMIVFPCRWDQPHNAARIVYHGLGVRGGMNSFSAMYVGSLIDTIENDSSFKGRIEAMSRRFRQIENSEIGARTVERIIAESAKRRTAPIV